MTPSDMRPVVLLDAVERLDDVVDRGRVDLSDAGLALARAEALGTASRQADLLDALALIRGQRDREFGLVEAALRRAVDVARRARSGDRRDQVVDRGLIDVTRGRRGLLPLF